MATVYDQTKDPYAKASTAALTGIGRNSIAVTPSDTADFASYPKAIVVTVAGNLVVLPLMAADDGSHTITFSSAPVGFVPPFRVRRVLSTSTTASAATIDD